MGAVRGPHRHQPRPVDFHLGFVRIPRGIFPHVPIKLNFHNWVCPQVQRPRVGTLKARVDVAQDQPFPVAQIEDWRGVLPARFASRGGEQEGRRERVEGPLSAGDAVHEPIQRRDKMLDEPHAQRRGCQFLDGGGYSQFENTARKYRRRFNL